MRHCWHSMLRHALAILLFVLFTKDSLPMFLALLSWLQTFRYSFFIFKIPEVATGTCSNASFV